MKIETLQTIVSIFKNCTIEPGLDGWSVFDSKKKFICLITIYGVALSETYPHYERLCQKLSSEKIAFWGLETTEKLTLQQIQDLLPEPEEEPTPAESLYQEPKAPLPHSFGDEESPF